MPVTTKNGAPAFAPEEARRMGQLTASLGMTADGPPLSARLSADETAKLAANVPIPKERLDRLRQCSERCSAGRSVLLTK